MSKEQLHVLSEKIDRMIGLSKSKVIEKPVAKKQVNENFITAFAELLSEPDPIEALLRTSGTKDILPIELKAAMLAHNFSEYQMALLGIYTKYVPFTKGASAGNTPNTITDKDSEEKVQGASDEFTRLTGSGNESLIKNKIKEIIKLNRIPVAYDNGEFRTREMSQDEKSYVAKWWTTKNYSLISYGKRGPQGESGLTPIGKAQLEFLARAYTGKPNDKKESTLFGILQDNGGHFSEIAESIIREFFTMAMIPFIMNLTKRANYNSNDLQLQEFIEIGINRALDQLPNYYDPARGNLGSFIITVVKNSIKNQLKAISDYKPDLSYAYDYLSSHPGPLKIYSIAPPQKVQGVYNNVALFKKGYKDPHNGKNHNPIYVYVYNNPVDAISDLEDNNSPLAKRYIVNPSRDQLYKSYAPHYDEVSDQMNYGELDPYEKEHYIDPYEKYKIFSVNKIPAEAKQEIYNILDKVLNIIISDYQTYGVKNINSFIKNNRDFVKQLMFSLLNFGDLIEVYTKTWVVKNDNGQITKFPPLQPVQYKIDNTGEKKEIPNIYGKLPTSKDVDWIWSTGEKNEEEVKANFIKNFIAGMQKQQANVPVDFPEKSKDIVNKIYGALRFYFGYQGKSNPVINKNRNDLNQILSNYAAAVAQTGLQENFRKQIRQLILKNINFENEKEYSNN